MLHSKYNRNNCMQNQNKKFYSYSPIWKSLLVHGWKLCNNNITHIVGNGKNISFWEDGWCTPKPLRELIHGPFPANESIRKVSSLINGNTWSICSLPFIIPEDIHYKILSIHIPLENKPHKLTWRLTQNGRFTTSSAYKSLQHPDNLPLHTSSKSNEFSLI